MKSTARSTYNINTKYSDITFNTLESLFSLTMKTVIIMASALVIAQGMVIALSLSLSFQTVR